MPNDVILTSSSSPDTPADGTMPPPDLTTVSGRMEAAFQQALAELAADNDIEPPPLAVAVLDMGAPPPVLSPIPEEICLQVQQMLGIKAEGWARIMPRGGATSVPRFALHKIVARMSLNIGTDNLGKLSQVVTIAKEIMEKPVEQDKTLTAETRLTAGKVASDAVTAMTKLFPELLKLADASGDRSPEDDRDSAAQKPKNLPPQLNVQFNMGTPVGGNGPAPYPVGAVVNSGNGVRNLPPTK
ncbi:MAG TPA: hypothetical protein VMQ76_12180 [Terracidiphilus sp.]|nr:hypothetical protein [Terracidiphilus sp.]